ncbi:hypothetical protein BGX38DRAFT_99612 [Terfezia claveryi]|nr:hypothetical protein BGX38DRAFT_99612 [Terfezia claveryi]
MIMRNLRSNGELCDHVRNLTVHAGETWKLELDCLGTLDKILLNTGIITPAGNSNSNLVRFTSPLIFRVCVEALFPCCTLLATVEGPIELITTAIQHLSRNNFETNRCIIKRDHQRMHFMSNCMQYCDTSYRSNGFAQVKHECLVKQNVWTC